MRVLSLMMGLTTLAASTVFCASAMANEESQLVQQINEYRSQVQRCGDQDSRNCRHWRATHGWCCRPLTSATFSRRWPGPRIRW